MDRHTEVQNSLFWERKVMSMESILKLKSGEEMDIESSILLNPRVSPSPEDELSALETLMTTQVNFAEISDSFIDLLFNHVKLSPGFKSFQQKRVQSEGFAITFDCPGSLIHLNIIIAKR